MANALPLSRDKKTMSTVGNYTLLNLAPKNLVNYFQCSKEFVENLHSKTQKNQGHVVTGEGETALK